MKKISLYLFQFSGFALLSAALFLSNCSDNDDPGTNCATVVTYNGVGQVKELFQAKCVGGSCHPTNGDWFTYSTAFANRSEIKSRTQSGNMPKVGTLTADEKALIACWVDNGAPEN